MHTRMHARLHTYICTYIRTWLHTYISVPLSAQAVSISAQVLKALLALLDFLCCSGCAKVLEFQGLRTLIIVGQSQLLQQEKADESDLTNVFAGLP